MTLTPLTPLLQDAKPADNPQAVKDAARKFEALLVAQMLKTARESGSSGWTGQTEDQATASLFEIAEQQFAELLSMQGGLGLANMVVQQLESEAQR